MGKTPPREPDNQRHIKTSSQSVDRGIKQDVRTLDRVKASLSAARWILMATLVMFVFLALSGQINWFETILFSMTLLIVASLGAPGAASVMRSSAFVPIAAPIGPPDQLSQEVRVILDCLPEPCIILDMGKKVAHANLASKQIYPALRRGEPISFGLRQPDLLGAIQRVLVDGQPAKVSYADRVPHEVFLSAHITPLLVNHTSQAQLPSWLMVAFSNKTSEQLAEKMRVDFVANASHELRTPLQAFMGFLDTLAGSAKDDEEAQAEFIRIMRAQSERMSRLIDDLMSLSHIELNRHVRPTQRIDLALVIKEVINMASAQADQEGVHIHFEQLIENAIVTGDKDQLFQVFENLVQNALKYGSAGKKIDIRIMPAKSRYHHVWVNVIDYGVGIASEHVPRLTERFYRVDVETSREKKGTGLGLAIVKHILVRHRGELAIKSTPGEGTTFTVKI